MRKKLHLAKRKLLLFNVHFHLFLALEVLHADFFPTSSVTDTYQTRKNI